DDPAPSCRSFGCAGGRGAELAVAVLVSPRGALLALGRARRSSVAAPRALLPPPDRDLPAAACFRAPRLGGTRTPPRPPRPRGGGGEGRGGAGPGPVVRGAPRLVSEGGARGGTGREGSGWRGADEADARRSLAALPRRPDETTPAEQVDVEVEDRLAGRLAAV